MLYSVGWNTGFVPVLISHTDALLWPGGRYANYIRCAIASSHAAGANHLIPLFTVLTWVENGVEHRDAVRIVPCY
jgi:hypothetical protein